MDSLQVAAGLPPHRSGGGSTAPELLSGVVSGLLVQSMRVWDEGRQRCAQPWPHPTGSEGQLVSYLTPWK